MKQMPATRPESIDEAVHRCEERAARYHERVLRARAVAGEQARERYEQIFDDHFVVN
jgi:hypothetical protein